MSRQQVPNAEVGRDTARANLLTNGGFEIWQRGNGPFTTNGGFSADRWRLLPGGSSTLSVSRGSFGSGPGTAISYAAQLTYTHNVDSVLDQVLMLSEYQGLKGQRISVSMRMFASVAGALSVKLGGDGTGMAEVSSASHPGTGVWVTSTAENYLVPIDATYVRVQVVLHATGTYYIDNATLVVGTVPADYAPLHPADDLARCLRYYEVLGDTASGALFVQGYNGASTWIYNTIPYKVRKPSSVTPTVTLNGTWTYTNASGLVVTASDMFATSMRLTVTAAGYGYAMNGAGANITIESNP